MLSQPMPIFELDARFCDLLLGWDELEQKLDAPTLVDQNMIGWKTKKTYNKREDVLRDLDGLRVIFPR
jgi:hypothetical protein